MTDKQHITQVNNYYMLNGLHEAFGEDPEWIHVKRNQNTVADQIINWGTKTGDFNTGCYSLNALKDIYEARSFYSFKDENGQKQTIKIEKDHTVKTKTLAVEVWENMDNFSGPEDFISFLLENVYILNMTRAENKHKDAKNISEPIERYRALGIDVVYKKVKNFQWSSIDSFESMLGNFEAIQLEEWLILAPLKDEV